jgi:hypothetical protein
MPTVAEDSLVPPHRFVVYLEEGSSFVPNRALTVINLRKQVKGLGSCSLKYIPKNSFAYDKTIVVSKPRPAQRFIVIDTYGLEKIPKSVDISTDLNVIFYGRVRTISLDKFKDTDDYMGEIAGDEEGWFFAQQPMFNCDDIPFNAVITPEGSSNGYYLGNKADDESILRFEKYNPRKLKDSEVAETAWAKTDAPYVWSLEDAINFIGQTASITFKFPWEIDNERIKEHNDAIEVPDGETLEDQPTYVSGTINKNKYVVFLDKIKPKSYTSPYGKTVIEWLEENLLDNFTFSFDYISSGSVQCSIINTSLVDTDLFPKAILPTDVTINSRNTNVSVTEVGETYTQVEVVSNRILFAGTLTTKNLANGQKTMDRTWEYEDEKNYAFGSTTGKEATHPDSFRKSFKNQSTYHEFKFITDPNSDCPITVSAPMNFTNEFTERERTPFFPFVGVVEKTGELTISKSFNSHKTPDVSNISWAQTLPFGYTDSTSKYNLFEPFVSITVTTEKEPNEKSIVHLVGGVAKPGLDLGETITIKQDPAQAFGYLTNDAKLFEINGQTFTPSTNPTSGAGGSYDWALGSSFADVNPATTSLGVYPLFTHWSMIYLTIAGYSAQRISLFKVKDNPGVSTRRKVIQADDCEYWIVHPGTFKPAVTINSEASKQGYAWVPEIVLDNKKKMVDPKVLRNDYKKQKSYLDMYSAFLFLDKKAVTLDFTLDGWTNTFKIGQPIGSVKDTQTIVTNSVVESIEYFVEGSTPRIRVSTLIPELPPLKKLGESIRISSEMPSLSRMTKYKDTTLTIKAEEKKGNITTIQGIGGGGGGGGATTKEEIWLKVVTGEGAGNTLASGQYGIKKVVAWTQLTDWKDVYATSSLPDGLGRATLWSDGVQQFTSDAPLYVAGATYSLNQQVSFNDQGYKCSVPGVSTTFNVGTAQFVSDPTITKKPKQVFLILDDRAQFNYAVQNGEWLRVFSLVDFGEAVNPASGVSEKQQAYTGAFF